MKKMSLLASLVLMGTILNLGSIRKQEDPITKTQTEPISLKQKMEEMKDGPKGAPTPSFKLYPKEGFQIEPPVAHAEEEIPDHVLTNKKVTEVQPVVAQNNTQEDIWSEEEQEAEPVVQEASKPAEAAEAVQVPEDVTPSDEWKSQTQASAEGEDEGDDEGEDEGEETGEE